MKDQEHQEQKHVMLWAGIQAKSMFPELRLLYAIPNGGDRDVRVATKLKAEGVRAGVPDFHLPIARHGYHSLYIEMKKPSAKPKRGGKGGVSTAQRWWIDELGKHFNKVVVCYGADEAIEAIKDYLEP